MGASLIKDELNIVNTLYSWKIAEARKRLEEKLENEIYVTDLIYCPLKYRFQRLYKELAIGAAFSPAALYGEIIHQGLEKLLQTLFGVDNVKIEVEYERYVRTDFDGNTYTVKGRVDAVIGDYVIEIKSSSSDKNLPHEPHITQAKIYLWLSNLSKALLLYITPSRVVEFRVMGAVSDEELVRLVESVIIGQPAPRYSWECRYCIYSILCPRKMTSA